MHEVTGRLAELIVDRLDLREGGGIEMAYSPFIERPKNPPVVVAFDGIEHVSRKGADVPCRGFAKDLWAKAVDRHFRLDRHDHPGGGFERLGHRGLPPDDPGTGATASRARLGRREKPARGRRSVRWEQSPVGK